ncbi:MAG: hypothetical protein AAB591_01165 [Patescibacteria group bacterium]
MQVAAVRHHWPAFVLATAVGLVLVSGPLVAKVRSGVAFGHPLNIRIDDEFFYFARIREVLDGHPMIGNPYLAEHKAKPPAPVFLGELLAAQPQRWLGGNVVAWGVFYDFLFPALITLLTYACLFLVTRLRWLSSISTAFLLLGWSPSTFARAVSPQLNFLFWLTLFLLTFLLATRPVDSRRKRLLVGLAALNFGLLFYLYTYYWTFWLAALAILAVLFLLSGEREKSMAFASVAGGGLILALPYAVLMLRAVRLPEYAETLRRIGMIESHFPSGLAIVFPAVGLLAMGALLLWRRAILLDAVTLFLAAGILAAVVSVNQHVVTGKNLEFSSHYLMLSVFWFVFSGAWLVAKVWAAAGRRRWLWAAAVSIAPAASVLLTFTNAPVWVRPPSEKLLALERYRPVLAALTAEVKRDDVVWTPGPLASLIPIYTPANVYYENASRLSFLSDEEVLDRFAIAHYFTATDDAFVRERLRGVFGVYDINRVAHARRENQARSLLGLAPKPVEPATEKQVSLVLTRLAEARGNDFERELKKYRADYIVWDRASLPSAPFDGLPWLDPVAAVDEFRIYRVR